MFLDKKRVLLTGASGGIGDAIAQAMAQSGAQLITVGRDRVKLEKLVQQLPGQHHVICADLTREDERQSLLSTVSALGGIDILINNAGISQFAFLEQQSTALIEDQITLNLLAPILLTQAFLPMLRQSSEPVVVNIGSTFGSIGYSGLAPYCASKFGLRGFTEALRRELADSPFRVLYLAPRATKTAINSKRVCELNQQLGNSMDKPQAVATQLLNFLTKSHAQERYMGWPEKLFIRINSLLPRLVDKALFKQLPTIRRFAHL